MQELHKQQAAYRGLLQRNREQHMQGLRAGPDGSTPTALPLPFVLIQVLACCFAPTHFSFAVLLFVRLSFRRRQCFVQILADIWELARATIYARCTLISNNCCGLQVDPGAVVEIQISSDSKVAQFDFRRCCTLLCLQPAALQLPRL